MKKMMLLGALMVCTAAIGHAQESRQDASVSFTGVFAPAVYGVSVHPMTTTTTGGFLGSYRYMVTPRSALEANYTFSQNSLKYNAPSAGCDNFGCRANTREQELSVAYVYSRTYGRYNPFLEGGVGVTLFTPILNYGTTKKDIKSANELGGLFGGGLAYEINPSFDIRVGYRGFLMKATDLGYPNVEAKRYYILMTPSLGVAYHF
jgi:outer membrane immunogenic protein